MLGCDGVRKSEKQIASIIVAPMRHGIVNNAIL